MPWWVLGMIPLHRTCCVWASAVMTCFASSVIFAPACLAFVVALGRLLRRLSCSDRRVSAGHQSTIPPAPCGRPSMNQPWTLTSSSYQVCPTLEDICTDMFSASTNHCVIVMHTLLCRCICRVHAPVTCMRLCLRARVFSFVYTQTFLYARLCLHVYIYPYVHQYVCSI